MPALCTPVASCAVWKSTALRGRRQRAAAPSALPARGLRPFDPRFDAASCQAPGAHAYGIDSSRQLVIEVSILMKAFIQPIVTVADASTRHNGGMRRCADYASSITCRGSGGALRPQQGARGAEPARKYYAIGYW